MNDNRNYTFPEGYQEGRSEYNLIIDMIPAGSKVIDLGCGNGILLEKLKKTKSIIDAGIEISPVGVEMCQKKGLNVKIGRIDEKIDFADNSFDYSICNVTIQMVMYPEILLQEMKRISRYQIISFPNFGFYRNRIEYLFRGGMPKHSLYGYKWHNTGHIHQCSVSDFLELVKETNLRIIEYKYIKPANRIKAFLMESFPNLFQILPVYLLKAHK